MLHCNVINITNYVIWDLPILKNVSVMPSVSWNDQRKKNSFSKEKNSEFFSCLWGVD